MSRIESPDVQLIELLRRSDAPSEEDRRRIGAAVSVRLAVGIGASTALLAVTHTAWAARLGLLGTWGKGLLLVTSLVGIGVGITWYAKPEALWLTASPTAVTHNPTSDALLPPTELPQRSAEADVVAPEASSRTPEASPKTRTAPAKSANRGTTSSLEAELEIVGRAQGALKSGQPNEALRALDEHARRFPSGVLALERSGVRTVALCQAGRLEEGRAAALSYLRLAPNSVLSKRIRVACQLPGG